MTQSLLQFMQASDGATLRSVYPLDETSGTTVTDVVGGYHGSLTGISFSTAFPTNPRRISGSYSFGGNDFIDLTPCIAGQSYSSWAINFWIRTNQASSTIFQIGPKSGSVMEIRLYDGFIDITGGYQILRSIQLCNNNQGHHVLVRVYGNLSILYVDGILQGSTTQKAARPLTGGLFAGGTISSANDVTNDFSGYLSYIGVYTDYSVNNRLDYYKAGWYDLDDPPALYKPDVLHPWLDAVYGGPSRVRGTVTRLGSPGPYKTRLFRRSDGLKVRELASASDGAYDFKGVANLDNGYFVVAHDNPSESPLNAAIADLVTSTVMLDES